MDLISNTLTKIRNANKTQNPTVLIPNINQNLQILHILKKEGFINSYSVREPNVLQIHLKYQENKKTVLMNLKRISTPGRRIYVQAKQIPILFGGLGIYILSTSKGLLTNKEAHKYNIGGELLCSVW
uniref:Small ribosomal subunit protein uS8c n=1 Tax=Codium arenicola TaxID=1191365 RepID=A0A2P0QI07_9CHLO|nr:ribosomal protein S8 [Codium arenicola]ARO74383.1 ribosomal protein S8 [Codium arenicola]